MVKILKDKSFEINNSLIEKIISNEEDLEKREVEKVNGMLDWKVLEEKITQSRINGYKTDIILGKKAKDLEVELFISFIP